MPAATQANKHRGARRSQKLTVSAANIPSVSLVVPAFNEEQRLPPTLRQIEAYAAQWFRAHAGEGPWEVLVADDGSVDRTPDIVRRHAATWSPDAGTLHLLRLTHRGKGYAVREGMLAARGRWLVLTDADLSAPIADTQLLLEALRAGADVAIGSRDPARGGRRLDEPRARRVSSRVFNILTQCIALRGITDTQCGFKAFWRSAARQLFTRQRVMGLAFDVELLYLARRLGYQIAEVPITWRYQSGTRIRPVVDALRMAGDLVRLRALDALDAYDLATAEIPLLAPPSTELISALDGGSAQ
jgi:dolichyl-phosphate beta-glucosyltransferase